jgi:hypothetical protein
MLMALTIMPAFVPANKKAITIGISQNEKNRNGARGKGIFGPYMFRAVASAVKMITNDKKRVFTWFDPSCCSMSDTYLRVATQKRVGYEFGLRYLNTKTNS